MVDCSETLRGILSRLEKLDGEIAAQQMCEVRRSSLEYRSARKGNVFHTNVR